MNRPQFSSRSFGRMPDGRDVIAYRLSMPGGFSVEVITYGCIITSLLAPDRKGIYANVVLGFDHLESYLLDQNYIGAVVGRVANRIAQGKFALDDKIYHLSLNHPPHHLHGGYAGLHNRLWEAEPYLMHDRVGVRLTANSLDGEEGYPGNLDATVIYELAADHTLIVRYEAAADRDTVFNPTQHSYFNLDLQGGAILGHALRIHADATLETDNLLVPTGKILPVAGTPLDYNSEKNLRSLGQSGCALDHSWVLKRPGLHEVSASLYAEGSGRRLDVLTEAPTLHVYSGQGLQAVGPFSGICLEAQGYADAPNHPGFPSIVLRAGEAWHSETRFIFSADAPTRDR